MHGLDQPSRKAWATPSVSQVSLKSTTKRATLPNQSRKSNQSLETHSSPVMRYDLSHQAGTRSSSKSRTCQERKMPERPDKARKGAYLPSKTEGPQIVRVSEGQINSPNTFKAVLRKPRITSRSAVDPKSTTSRERWSNPVGRQRNFMRYRWVGSTHHNAVNARHTEQPTLRPSTVEQAAPLVRFQSALSVTQKPFHFKNERLLRGRDNTVRGKQPVQRKLHPRGVNHTTNGATVRTGALETLRRNGGTSARTVL